MKYHLISTVGIICILVCSFSVHATIHQNPQSTTPFETINNADTSFTDNHTTVATTGPISPWFEIAEISFIEGPIWKSRLISFLLSNRNLHFIIPLLYVDVEDLTFSVRYSKDIPDGPFMQKYAYSTVIIENSSTTVYNTSHTIIITGFNGIFTMTRAKPLRLTPAYFSFTGKCDETLLIT